VYIGCDAHRYDKKLFLEWCVEIFRTKPDIKPVPTGISEIDAFCSNSSNEKVEVDINFLFESFIQDSIRNNCEHVAKGRQARSVSIISTRDSDPTDLSKKTDTETGAWLNPKPTSQPQPKPEQKHDIWEQVSRRKKSSVWDSGSVSAGQTKITADMVSNNF
jgi:hypothetical protein